MKLNELTKALNMTVLTGDKDLNNNIEGVYVCDLLSWVMSHAHKGNAWITVLTNINIVAVALLAEVACIIVPEEIKIDEITIKKAEQEGVVILSTDLSGYEICWRIKQFERL